MEDTKQELNLSDKKWNYLFPKEFTVKLKWDEFGWFAESKDLSDCAFWQGNTVEESLQNMLKMYLINHGDLEDVLPILNKEIKKIEESCKNG